LKIKVALALIVLALNPRLPAQTIAVKIFTDSTLWGKDLGVLLSQLRSLQEAGEKTVYVFPDRVAGATPYVQAPAAQRAVARLNSAIIRNRQRPLKDPYAAIAAPGAVRAATLRAESVRLVTDGDGYHISFGAGLQFFPPGLTIKAVHDRLGPPERSVLLTIQTIGDRRPVILTLHVYAGGAISFAESDLAEPGIVERILLNLAQLVPVVSQ
jgi:hypothetical protein